MLTQPSKVTLEDALKHSANNLDGSLQKVWRGTSAQSRSRTVPSWTLTSPFPRNFLSPPFGQHMVWRILSSRPESDCDLFF